MSGIGSADLSSLCNALSNNSQHHLGERIDGLLHPPEFYLEYTPFQTAASKLVRSYDAVPDPILLRRVVKKIVRFVVFKFAGLFDYIAQRLNTRSKERFIQSSIEDLSRDLNRIHLEYNGQQLVIEPGKTALQKAREIYERIVTDLETGYYDRGTRKLYQKASTINARRLFAASFCHQYNQSGFTPIVALLRDRLAAKVAALRLPALQILSDQTSHPEHLFNSRDFFLQSRIELAIVSQWNPLEQVARLEVTRRTNLMNNICYLKVRRIN